MLGLAASGTDKDTTAAFYLGNRLFGADDFITWTQSLQIHCNTSLHAGALNPSGLPKLLEYQ
jgi:hypothetical protein